MSVILTADVHIREAGPWLRHRTIKSDQFVALAHLVQLCIRHDAHLLIAGDLFDTSSPEPVCLKAVHDAATALQQHGKRLAYIQGDHDKRIPPYLNVSSRSAVEWLHGRVENFDDFTVLGMDFSEEEDLDAACKRMRDEPVDAFLCHQKWPDFVPGYTQTIKLSEIPVPMIWTGDFHIHLSDMYGNVEVFSPGSASPTAIDECLPRRCWLFERKGEKPKSLQIISRAIHRLTVANEEELNALFDADRIDALTFHDPMVPPSVAKPVINIKYANDIPDAYNRLMRVFDERAHLMLEPLSSRRQHTDDKRRKVAVDGLKATPDDIYEIAAEVSDDTWERDAIISLCTSDTPKTIIRDLEDAFFSEDTHAS